MPGGTQQEFFLREGEDLSKMVRTFCRKHGLEGEDVINALEESIRKQAPPGTTCGPTQLTGLTEGL